MPRFFFDNSYARELPGFYAPCRPKTVRAPRLLFLNRPLADELHLDLEDGNAEAHAALFAGNALPDGAEPIAQAYAGHQFGGFSPQLGDGRALLIGEVLDRHGRRRDIAFKGSGRTPFSRGGDGKAAIGPMLREVLIGEAIHALGIPTTRALAVVATGEPVQRETLLPGAVPWQNEPLAPCEAMIGTSICQTGVSAMFKSVITCIMAGEPLPGERPRIPQHACR